MSSHDFIGIGSYVVRRHCWLEVYLLLGKFLQCWFYKTYI